MTMDISGTTRVFLILGDPVAQVRAPEAFNHLFRKHGVDAVLVPVHVAPEDFPGFLLHAMKARNIEGVWLTIPHKAAAMELLDSCDRLGRAAGAVNAVRRNAQGLLEGALFDGVGFARSLTHFGIAVAGQRVLLVGAGGAGVAIAASLAAEGAALVALYDNSPGRADPIAERLSRELGAQVSSVGTSDPAGFDLVVNATPLGLKPGDPLPFDVARLDPGASVVDILMKNQPTALLRACHGRGITAHPGYEMMVQQMPAYLTFFGFDDIASAVSQDASDVRALMSPT